MSSEKQKSLARQLIIGLLAFALSVTVVLAQDSASRVLTLGTAVTGALDGTNPVQVYTFLGKANEGYQLAATTSATVSLFLRITDANGEPVSSNGGGEGSAEGSNTSTAFILPADGVYYATVVSLDGVTDTAIPFELTLTLQSSSSGAVFTPPGEVLTATGLQVKLTWNSEANMDLEVRDSVGGSVYFDTPTAASGGQFVGTNANSVCNSRTASAPTEQVQWPAGVVPSGSYEMLVYYQPLQDCPTTDSVAFTIDATVDGKVVPTFEGILDPNEVFIASFVINSDGTVTPGKSGVKIDPPAAPDLGSVTPTPLTLGAPVISAITNEQPFEAYTFTAQAGQVVSVELNATSGSLDTVLLLIDPNGNVIGTNDDREQGVTNSALLNTTLILNGDYTVIATRYGQAIGGTQGDYTLTLSGETTVDSASGQTIAPPDLPNLPNGSVEVSLQWATSADLQLLVRDPQGNSVFDDRPQISSGGTLAANGNVNCTPAEGSPVSYIYWPEGRLPPAGPYEIEVQYQNQCNDTTPVQFTLNVVVNGVVVLSATEQPLPGERYVTSFSIGVDGQIAAGEGGFFGTVQRADSASLDYLSQIENAPLLTSGQTVQGDVRLDNKFDVYVFDGQAGEKVTVGMEALNGTLDPLLFLLDPNGVQVAQNDDATSTPATANSLISEFTLPEDGRYIIIATHFGARYGVTSGAYNLTLRLN